MIIEIMKEDRKITEEMKKTKKESKSKNKDAAKIAQDLVLKNALEGLVENKWIVILMKKAKNAKGAVNLMRCLLKNAQRVKGNGGENLKIKMNLKNNLEDLKQEETAELKKEKQMDLFGLEDGEIHLKKYSL